MAGEAEPVGILVVDDRPQDLLVVDAVLGDQGYDLVKVTSGHAALRELLVRDFAVILVDVHMPEMNGFELASLIRSRARSAHTPIIFLTGADPDLGQIYRAYEAGAIDYLQKPVDGEVLRCKVAVFAGRFQLERRIREQAATLVEVERRNRMLELEKLRLASTVRYRSLADAIPHVVWTADTAGRLTYRNRRWIEYTGLGQDGSWVDVIHPDDRADVEARWTEALAARSAFEIECRLRGADGTYRWHLCRALPDAAVDGALPDSDDSPPQVGWVGTMTDCDDLHRARALAEGAQRRSALVAEATAAMSATLDHAAGLAELAHLLVPAVADCCIIEVTATDDAAVPPITIHADPARRRHVEQIGVHLAGAAPERRPPAFASRRPELIRGPRDRMIAELTTDPGQAILLGELEPVSAITVPILDHGGALGTILLITTTASGRTLGLEDLAMAADVGRRAGVAIENALLYRRAERAVRLRDDFLSTASHELRTPLSALLVQLGGLERTIERGRPALADDPGRAMKKVTGALRHTTRLTRLVDSLLDVSRLSAHRLHLQPESFDLADVVRDVGDRFAEEARQAGCRLSVRASPGATGTWDRMRLEQVVTNLLSNAVKYGRGKPIEVVVATDAEHATVTVRDHGIGIAADDQLRIFEQFERAVSTQNYGGLGLGLYISKELVTAHGGTIEVESTPGEGAAFKVVLPRGGS
jgi:PAS domain S-box-containing protein